MDLVSQTNERAAAVAESVPKILLAEDQPVMRELVARTLRGAGYDVVEVQDGDALWRELADPRPDEDNPRAPDLVISDIRMPGLDGLEVLARIRQRAPTTPVILMTAFGDPLTLLRAMDLGASWVFSKPFDLKQLVVAAIGLVEPPNH